MSLSELLTEHYAWVDVLLSLKYNQYALNAETAGEFTTMGLLKEEDTEDKEDTEDTEDTEEQDTALLQRKRSKSGSKKNRLRCQSPVPAHQVDDNWVIDNDLSIDWAVIEEW